jgi:hypothetical protein
LFDNFNYLNHLAEFPIHTWFGIELPEYGDVRTKQEKTPNASVDKDRTTPFPPELDDLIRLHHLVLSRKVTTILEFGVGKSTVVFAHALSVNEARHGAYVQDNLRRNNPFELHSVDNNSHWLEQVRGTWPPSAFAGPERVTLHHCPLTTGTFLDRVCTYYEGIPDLCPDLIYLDGPDQFSAEGSVRGLSTRHKDRMPMAADILAFEHFLTPGTLIVVDGRTANARFLKCNLQRDWSHIHIPAYDQHFFELTEAPLGVFNQRQIDHCLGTEFYDRIP